MTKKSLPIDDLLRWTYRDELPKDNATAFLRPDGFGFGWGAVSKAGKYLADVQEPDLRNRFGITPDLTSKSQPHPDAARIWFEVQTISNFRIPEEWNPIADLGDLAHYGEAAIVKGLDRLFLRAVPAASASLVSTRSAAGDRRRAGGTLVLLRAPPELIQKFAILGGCPPWEAEKPEFCTVKSKNGRPAWFINEDVTVDGESIEVETRNGLDPKRRLPKAGAYLKHYYDPDPADVVEARAEYEIWHAAISAVAEGLAGRLEEYEPLPPSLPIRPWEANDKG